MKGALSSTWILFVLLPLLILFPILLIIAIPGAIVMSWILMRTPKPKPYTFDDWWEDNWRSYL